MSAPAIVDPHLVDERSEPWNELLSALRVERLARAGEDVAGDVTERFVRSCRRLPPGGQRRRFNPMSVRAARHLRGYRVGFSFPVSVRRSQANPGRSATRASTAT